MEPGMMAWMAAGRSTPAAPPLPLPLPPPVFPAGVALGVGAAATVVVDACLPAMGQAEARPPRRRNENCWARIVEGIAS